MVDLAGVLLLAWDRRHVGTSVAGPSSGELLTQSPLARQTRPPHWRRLPHRSPRSLRVPATGHQRHDRDGQQNAPSTSHRATARGRRRRAVLPRPRAARRDALRGRSGGADPRPATSRRAPARPPPSESARRRGRCPPAASTAKVRMAPTARRKMLTPTPIGCAHIMEPPQALRSAQPPHRLNDHTRYPSRSPRAAPSLTRVGADDRAVGRVRWCPRVYPHDLPTTSGSGDSNFSRRLTPSERLPGTPPNLL